MNNYIVTIYNSDMRHDPVTILADNPAEAAEQFVQSVDIPTYPFVGTVVVSSQGYNRYNFKFDVIIG